MNPNISPQLFSNLDDILNNTYSKLLEVGEKVEGKRGKFNELCNFSFTLENPRARVSRSLERGKVISKFAEFVWYATASSDIEFIRQYIKAYKDEDSERGQILGAYGPKIFGKKKAVFSQFDRVCKQINERKLTKQAVLIISENVDFKIHKETSSSPPCTIALHFLVRNNKLNLTTYMRSNDAYWGLPHDLFCFTMIQEIISLITKIELGSYTHVCTSMHVYEKYLEKIKLYIDEGFQENLTMPPLKSWDKNIIDSLKLAFDSRLEINDSFQLDEYWNDFVMFSKRYYPPAMNESDWLNKFKLPELKELASLSISK